jgi:hypothetical protein
MEVHAHAHTERKKWTHYLWEFLMLFLAVFCGFLAEYQLEHKIEKSREEQFMRSMIEDLKADTANIAHLKKLRDVKLQMSDSLCTAIIEKRYTENGAAFYYYGRNVSRRAFFFSADGTMQQLKNSGGLRLISKTAISDKIIAYDVLYREIISQQQYVELQINEYRELAGKVFDASVFRSMPTLNDTILTIRLAGNPQLADHSPGLLNEMANKLNYWSLGSSRLSTLLEQLRKKADDLIELIKKEYHLK